ncbi:response regulator transcription factor [Acaryochloris thomasi]|nr:response regulator [Acaryochloris thomasi]
MIKILVIEDEVAVRANIAELLHEEEYQVITAENGFVGILWAQEHLPDLIICDMMMPALDGRDVLKALREDSITESIPFIFLTARADKSDIRVGMNLGADDYLTKPFSRQELLETVEARLQKHQSHERRYQKAHERAASLQQQVQELQQGQENKVKDLEQRLQGAAPKLSKAIKLLINIPPGVYRNSCLELLQDTFDEEIVAIKELPDFSELSADNDLDLLQELSLI